jgi:hypothetical protein
MALHNRLIVLAFVILVPSRVAWPEPLDAPSAQALSQTLQALQGGGSLQLDSRLRGIQDSPELTKEFNELAAAIFTEVTEHGGGDPERMSESLARAKSDPAGFVATLSPATRARLTALVGKLSSAPE